MTNQERRERRREAARKAAETRRQSAEAGRLETQEERNTRVQEAEEKRLTNLRFVLAEAQRLQRESDLYYRAHTNGWSHHPRQWTAEQIDTARRFLQGFVRTDGTPDPYPIRRKGRWRL